MTFKKLLLNFEILLGEFLMFSVFGSIKNIPHTFLWLIKIHIHPISIFSKSDIQTHSYLKSNFEAFYENN